MISKLEFLNKKRIKEIVSTIDANWSLSSQEPLMQYHYLLNNKSKVFIVAKDVESVDLSQMRIDSIGLYLGELMDGNFRLSIEGSQIIGPYAKKNVVEISDGLMKLWIRGYDLEVKNPSDCEDGAFVIIKNNSDFVGCGRFSSGKISNFISKSRRIRSED